MDRSILKLDMRAKQDVAYLGSKFMKFDGMRFIPTVLFVR